MSVNYMQVANKAIKFHSLFRLEHVNIAMDGQSPFLVYLNSLVAVGSSGILKAKQKLGVTFNFDKQDVIDFTKFSKM